MPARTHGMCRTPEYNTWCNMIARCEKPNRPDYKHYGGRGISVCRRWRDSFTAYLEDMGMRPFPRATLDRIDTNGGYCKENCRWVTQAEQVRNFSTRNVKLTIDGVTMVVQDWAAKTGLNPETIHGRLRRGWPASEAIKPALKRRWATQKGSIMIPAKNETV